MNGSFRPADIDQAEIAPVALSYLPLWRVDVTVEGFHVGLSRTSSGLSPTGGARHKDQVMLVLGRRLMLFDPSAKLQLEVRDKVVAEQHPSAFRAVAGKIKRWFA